MPDDLIGSLFCGVKTSSAIVAAPVDYKESSFRLEIFSEPKGKTKLTKNKWLREFFREIKIEEGTNYWRGEGFLDSRGRKLTCRKWGIFDCALNFALIFLYCSTEVFEL